MLKKTGIIVAVVAAATVAASPLAFAGEGNKSNHAWSGDRHSSSYEENTNVHVDNSVDRDQYNRCAFIQNEESTTQTPLLGVLPLLGDQVQALNCANFGDITVADLDD